MAQVLRPEWVEEYAPVALGDLLAVDQFDPPKRKKKEVKPEPPLAEPEKDPKWEPCPTGYVEFGPYYVRPKVTWVLQTHPFGCYALGINHVQLVVSRPTHKNGIRLTANDYVTGKDYRPKYVTREDQTFFQDTYGLGYPVEDFSLILLSRQPKHLELFKSLFKIGADNVWPGFIAQLGQCGMVLFGDVATTEISPFATGWLAWYLAQRGEGVLSSTHGVLNPNYPGAPRVCQMWAWTPPANAMLTTAAGHHVNTLKRSEKALQQSAVQRWQQNAGKIAQTAPEMCPLPLEDAELLAVSGV